jgi:uncharacterized membrane protein YbaN (DUF454 family)
MLSALKLSVFGILLGVAQATLFFVIVFAGFLNRDSTFKIWFSLELLFGMYFGWLLANAISKFPLPTSKYSWYKFFLCSLGFGCLVYGTQSLLIRFFNIPILMIPGVAESGVFLITRSTIEPLFQDNLTAVKRNFYRTIFGCIICAGFACVYALPSYFQISNAIREVREKFQLLEIKCEKLPSSYKSDGQCFTYPSGLGDRISAYEMRDAIEQALECNDDWNNVYWDRSSQEYRRYYTPNWKLEVEMVQTPTVFGEYSPKAIGYIRFDLSKR